MILSEKGQLPTPKGKVGGSTPLWDTIKAKRYSISVDLVACLAFSLSCFSRVTSISVHRWLRNVFVEAYADNKCAPDYSWP